MNNPTKEERATKLFQEGDQVKLANGGCILIPREATIAEQIGQAEKVARQAGYHSAMREVEEEINRKAMVKGAREETPEEPIRVSLLMNVDQDKAKGSFMLHDRIEIDGMNFQSAVRVADHCFKLALVELRQALHAWRSAPPESIHKM